MHNVIDLILQRVVQLLIAVAEGVHRDAGGEIQIFFSVRVVQIDAVAVLQHDLKPVVCVKHVLFRLIDVIRCCH